MTVSLDSFPPRRQRVSNSPQLAVLADDYRAGIMLRRLTSAGYRRVTVVTDATEVMSSPLGARPECVLAVLEPTLLNREQLLAFDQLGIAALGITAHRRHRMWAELLPLCETLWLFAPVTLYRRTLRDLDARRHSGAAFRLEE